MTEKNKQFTIEKPKIYNFSKMSEEQKKKIKDGPGLIKRRNSRRKSLKLNKNKQIQKEDDNNIKNVKQMASKQRKEIQTKIESNQQRKSSISRKRRYNEIEDEGQDINLVKKDESNPRKKAKLTLNAEKNKKETTIFSKLSKKAQKLQLKFLENEGTNSDDDEFDSDEYLAALKRMDDDESKMKRNEKNKKIAPNFMSAWDYKNELNTNKKYNQRRGNKEQNKEMKQKKVRKSSITFDDYIDDEDVVYRQENESFIQYLVKKMDSTGKDSAILFNYVTEKIQSWYNQTNDVNKSIANFEMTQIIQIIEFDIYENIYKEQMEQNEECKPFYVSNWNVHLTKEYKFRSKELKKYTKMDDGLNIRFSRLSENNRIFGGNDNIKDGHILAVMNGEVVIIKVMMAKRNKIL